MKMTRRLLEFTSQVLTTEEHELINRALQPWIERLSDGIRLECRDSGKIEPRAVIMETSHDSRGHFCCLDCGAPQDATRTSLRQIQMEMAILNLQQRNDKIISTVIKLEQTVEEQLKAMTDLIKRHTGDGETCYSLFKEKSLFATDDPIETGQRGGGSRIEQDDTSYWYTDGAYTMADGTAENLIGVEDESDIGLQANIHDTNQEENDDVKASMAIHKADGAPTQETNDHHDHHHHEKQDVHEQKAQSPQANDVRADNTSPAGSTPPPSPISTSLKTIPNSSPPPGITFPNHATHSSTAPSSQPTSTTVLSPCNSLRSASRKTSPSTVLLH